MDLLSEISDAFFLHGRAFVHITYLLLVFSMMMRNISWLRVIAIGSAVASLIYRLFFLFDPVSVAWQSVLILVNLVQLAILWSEHWGGGLSEDELHFIDKVIPNIHRSRARRVFKAGKWKLAGEGERLTTEGVVVPALIFLSSGSVRIDKDGQPVAICGRGDFIGEISFITGEPATADAVAIRPTRYLSFDRVALKRLLDSDSELKNGMEVSFNRNLIDKLVKSNQEKATYSRGGGEGAEAAVTQGSG
ncbi:MAG TPA: cyclic nucleotide-binding domain-containing protein [Devosiaceae bacterium]